MCICVGSTTTHLGIYLRDIISEVRRLSTGTFSRQHIVDNSGNENPGVWHGGPP